jgi:hypothetical protein
VPAAPDGEEPGMPANGDWEMTGPITDHALTGTHGTGAERMPWPDDPARLRKRDRKETGGWRSNPASGRSQRRSGRN